jgi:2'-5' RNA ligase
MRKGREATDGSLSHRTRETMSKQKSTTSYYPRPPKEGPDGPVKRLFTAIDIPQEIRDSICAALIDYPDLSARMGARLHLTLTFFGDTAESAIPELDRKLSLAAGPPPPKIELSSLGCFVRNYGKSILFAGLGPAPELQALKKNLDMATGFLKFTKGGKTKRFTPHLTLARFRPDEIPYPEDPGSLKLKGSFTALSFRLYESTLGYEGTKHTLINDYSLE